MNIVYVTFTHRGVFGVCPVYVADPYNEDAPHMTPRHRLLRPLMILSWTWWVVRTCVVAMFAVPDLSINVRVTGKLDQPISKWVEAGA